MTTNTIPVNAILVKTIPTVTPHTIRHRAGVTTWTIDCPHCGREHTHGAGPGHVVAHCRTGPNPGYVLTPPNET